MIRVSFISSNSSTPISVAHLSFLPSRDLYRSLCTEFFNIRSFLNGLFYLEILTDLSDLHPTRMSAFDLDASFSPVLSFRESCDCDESN